MASRRWSPSKISSANYCGMRWFLEYVKRTPRKRLSFYEKGGFVHEEMAHKFWDRLGKKYDSPETFKKYSMGKWTSRVIASETSENPIIWRDEQEKWIMKAQIGRLAPVLFDWLQQQGRPVFSELPIKFVFDKIRWDIRLDGVWLHDGIPVIRDYKTGSPRMGNMRLEYDPQPTSYVLGLSALAHTSAEIAELLGLKDEAHLLMGNGKIISNKIGIEYVMLEDKEDEKPIISVHRGTRNDRHYFELIEMIKGIEKRHEVGAIYPERGSKCDYCPVKEDCVEYSGRAPLETHNGEQRFFMFSRPPLYNPVTINGKTRVYQQRRMSKLYADARKRASAPSRAANSEQREAP